MLHVVVVIAAMIAFAYVYEVGLGPTCVQCGGKLGHRRDCPLDRD